jgi:hypothetical protein
MRPRRSGLHFGAPGAIAQLGERLDRTQEVGGSSPPSSIENRLLARGFRLPWRATRQAHDVLLGIRPDSPRARPSRHRVSGISVARHAARRCGARYSGRRTRSASRVGGDDAISVSRSMFVPGLETSCASATSRRSASARGRPRRSGRPRDSLAVPRSRRLRDPGQIASDQRVDLEQRSLDAVERKAGLRVGGGESLGEEPLERFLRIPDTDHSPAGIRRSAHHQTRALRGNGAPCCARAR